ncbi:MAG: sigma-70 family RNA polymerase sigma factor [Acidobacteriota bacterium]
MSGRHLVEQIASGNRAAESELVNELGRSTLLLLRHLTRDLDLAEDLCQETLRIVLTTLREGRLKHPGRLVAFVHGTAKNLVRAEWRRRQRRGPHEDVADLPLADDSPGQWDLASLAEDRAQIRRILDDLPSARDRQVLYSHYLAEDEKTEICDRLGIASGQFNLILFRARQRFRRLAEGEKHDFRRTPTRGRRGPTSPREVAAPLLACGPA